MNVTSRSSQTIVQSLLFSYYGGFQTRLVVFPTFHSTLLSPSLSVKRTNQLTDKTHTHTHHPPLTTYIPNLSGSEVPYNSSSKDT